MSRHSETSVKKEEINPKVPYGCKDRLGNGGTDGGLDLKREGLAE